jgi:hypothetical protein
LDLLIIPLNKTAVIGTKTGPDQGIIRFPEAKKKDKEDTFKCFTPSDAFRGGLLTSVFTGVAQQLTNQAQKRGNAQKSG